MIRTRTLSSFRGSQHDLMKLLHLLPRLTSHLIWPPLSLSLPGSFSAHRPMLDPMIVHRGSHDIHQVMIPVYPYVEKSTTKIQGSYHVVRIRTCMYGPGPGCYENDTPPNASFLAPPAEFQPLHPLFVFCAPPALLHVLSDRSSLIPSSRPSNQCQCHISLGLPD